MEQWHHCQWHTERSFSGWSFLGFWVTTLELITEFDGFVENGLQGKLGKPAYLEHWITTTTPVIAGESALKVTFDWDEDIGIPGAFLIKNNHRSEFYLRSLTLKDVPCQGRIHFFCNSWVYPKHKYKQDRIFFSNKVTSYYINDYGMFMQFPSFL